MDGPLPIWPPIVAGIIGVIAVLYSKWEDKRRAERRAEFDRIEQEMIAAERDGTLEPSHDAR